MIWTVRSDTTHAATMPKYSANRPSRSAGV